MSIDLNAIQARHKVSEALKVKPNGDSHTREYVRGLESVATDVPALLAYARDLEARNDKARELHRPITHHFLTPPAGSLEVCEACRWEYPCPTIAALTATEDRA